MSDDRDDDTDEPSISRRRDAPAYSFNPRTLLFAGALLAGGTVGGGGLTFAASGIVPAELKSDLASTKESVDELKRQMVLVQAALVRIEANSSSDRIVHDTMNGRITDHEERIRVLERRTR